MEGAARDGQGPVVDFLGPGDVTLVAVTEIKQPRSLQTLHVFECAFELRRHAFARRRATSVDETPSQPGIRFRRGMSRARICLVAAVLVLGVGRVAARTAEHAGWGREMSKPASPRARAPLPAAEALVWAAALHASESNSALLSQHDAAAIASAFAAARLAGVAASLHWRRELSAQVSQDLDGRAAFAEALRIHRDSILAEARAGRVREALRHARSFMSRDRGAAHTPLRRLAATTVEDGRDISGLMGERVDVLGAFEHYACVASVEDAGHDEHDSDCEQWWAEFELGGRRTRARVLPQEESSRWPCAAAAPLHGVLFSAGGEREEPTLLLEDAPFLCEEGNGCRVGARALQGADAASARRRGLLVLIAGMAPDIRERACAQHLLDLGAPSVEACVDMALRAVGEHDTEVGARTNGTATGTRRLLAVNIRPGLTKGRRRVWAGRFLFRDETETTPTLGGILHSAAEWRDAVEQSLWIIANQTWGQTSFELDFQDEVYVMGNTRDSCNNNEGTLMNLAKAAVQAASGSRYANPADYDHFMIYFRPGGFGKWAGKASLGGSNVWIKKMPLYVVVHELVSVLACALPQLAVGDVSLPLAGPQPGAASRQSVHARRSERRVRRHVRGVERSVEHFGWAPDSRLLRAHRTQHGRDG